MVCQFSKKTLKMSEFYLAELCKHIFSRPNHKRSAQMYGTLSGNIAAIIYYLYFQLIGLTVISLFFQREKPLSRLLMGSTAGSLLLTWLPAREQCMGMEEIYPEY